MKVPLFSSRWTLLAIVTLISMAALVASHGAEAAPDAVTLWNEGLTEEVKVIGDGTVIGVTATDLSSTGGVRNATVSDPSNPGDEINVTLYDDGTHGDAVAGDGNYTGNFTVRSDGGTSGSHTSEANATIDIAEGDPVQVYVDLDGDGSYSQVSVSTDYTGPGIATPFTGGFVSGELIITITIIVEGEAELDPGSVTYSIDGGPSVLFAQIGPDTFQAVIDTTLLTDGPHTVTTLSVDEAGNVGEGSFELIVDNTVPDIVFACTTIGADGDVLIGTTVTDMHLNHSTVMWRWDGGDWVLPFAEENGTAFDVVIPYDDMVPGEHSVEVRGKDLANNSMTLINRFVLPEQDPSALVVDLPLIDPSTLVACSTVSLEIGLENGGQVPLDLVVELVVDGEVVDTVHRRVDAGNDTPVQLTWPGIVPGDHDVEVIVTAPNSPSGDTPVRTLPLEPPGGGPITILPEPVDVISPPDVDPSDVSPGDSIPIATTVENPGALPQEVTVELVVDGVVVDTVTLTVPGGGSADVGLTWPSVAEGDHQVELRAYMPSSYGTGEPVDTAPVTDIDGGAVTIPPEDEDDGGGPLDFLDPVYEVPPFKWVPEGWRPWFIPGLVIIILIAILVIASRRRRPREIAGPEEAGLRAVEMPEVDEAPTPSTEPPPVDGDLRPAEMPAVTAAPERPAVHEAGTTTVEPPSPPASAPPPVVPPVASITREDGKGDPCVEVIRSHTRTREQVSEAQGAAEDARDEARRADDRADGAEGQAEEAERRAEDAERECEEARQAYEAEGVEDAEQAAEEAEERVSEMEDRMGELEGDIPPGDGVSTEPRPGWNEVGVGRGRMILPTSIWYRDAEAEREHLRKIDERYDEWKELKDGIEDARREAEEARREAEEAAERARDEEQRMDEACEEARRAREEAEGERAAAGEARQEADRLSGTARQAEEAAAAEDAAAAAERQKVEDCKDCLDAVRRARERIEALRRRYESLREGSQLSGPQGRLSRLDAKGQWDAWWDSFKRFRDEAKRLADIRNFTDADLPSEFTGIWDWGGPVGTAVGYGAEDVTGAVIPTDTIKAVGGLYAVFQASFDPSTALGGRILMEHLEPSEAERAAEAYRAFPRVMRDAVASFGNLQRLSELDAEIADALEEWEECLRGLPDPPETPEVDTDGLCLEQCREMLERLRELERRLRELISRAEDCRPSGLDSKFAEAERLKAGLRGMGGRMDRTRQGLEDYRRAQRANKKCYISTAAYGSPLAGELDTLRGFRDEVLSHSRAGRLLVGHYYRTAPAIAERLAEREGGQASVRRTLDLSVRLVRAREGRGRLTRGVLDLAAVAVYVVGSTQGWLLTRR